MRRLLFPYFVFTFLAVCLLKKSNAQTGLCPTNLDFEMGDFTGWACEAGIVDPAGNILISPTPPIPGRHTILPSGSGVDPWGGFPQNCPNGSGFSVRLGNSGGGHEAEGLSYTYTIPSTLTTFSMLFHYAVVLQDPNHLNYEQPRFRARIIDLTTGMPVPCVDFDFIASGTLPGFRPSPMGNSVVYKDWTPITINLTPYIGRTIKLEFITNDCVYTAHFGYAYVDVNTNCNGAITGNYICPGEPGITLTAPFGFQGYRWFADATFPLPEIGFGQTLTLNPAPSVGSVFPVEITPFPGYGCLDTLYAIVDVATAPPKTAGPDKVICQGQTVQVGSPPIVAHTYSWTPVGLLSNPAVANPFAGPVSAPTEIYLEMTDILTGCSTLDTVLVSKTDVDTTVTSTGDFDICVGEPGGSFSVNNASTSIQWYEATAGLIAGANSLTYMPTVSGSYWASMMQGGCLDSSGFHDFFIRPLPIVAFSPSNDSGCIASTTLTFTNQSNAPDGAAMTYLWKYSDGITDVNMDASRNFGRVGTHNVKLITTTQFGCVDSTDTDVHIMPKGLPDFTWDSICTGRPMQFSNQSRENNSPQAWYSWNFGNGDPLNPAKDPPPVTYNTPPGPIDVTLKMTTLGCETDTLTMVKTVVVNKQAPGYRYRTVTVPQGGAHYLHVRDTIGTVYSWRPAMHLSSYNTRYTEFIANGNDVEYLIDITDLHTCVTTDTVLMQVLKKTGFYLPTAFTPNNDGLNDVARPYLVGMKGLKSFSLFNRTGQLLFFSKTYGEGWDGTYKGVKQATGVYVWVLEFYDSNIKLVTEKGTLTLIR